MVSKDGIIGRTVSAYNPRGRSGGGMIRTATIIFILLVRTVHVCFYIARSAINSRIASLVIGCIFGLLGTILIAYCLAQIAAATGKARVLGINWGRWHFDAVLAFSAAVSIVLLVFTIITGGNTRTTGLFVAWCILWVIIALFAWVAEKAGTTETTYV
ncbi:hypothetical protein LIA77_03646 [Sarocladium implicatum]|nr:hypothetical protein LIA77_03646 [Sarocladium implicatum]